MSLLKCEMLFLWGLDLIPDLDYFFLIVWLHSYFELCTSETLTGIQEGSLILDRE